MKEIWADDYHLLYQKPAGFGDWYKLESFYTFEEAEAAFKKAVSKESPHRYCVIRTHVDMLLEGVYKKE